MSIAIQLEASPLDWTLEALGAKVLANMTATYWQVSRLVHASDSLFYNKNVSAHFGQCY